MRRHDAPDRSREFLLCILILEEFLASRALVAILRIAILGAGRIGLQMLGQRMARLISGHRKFKRITPVVRHDLRNLFGQVECLMAETAAGECDSLSIILNDAVCMLSVHVAAAFSALTINGVYLDLKRDLLRRPACDPLHHI